MELRDATAKELTHALMAKRGVYGAFRLRGKAKQLYEEYSMAELSDALKVRKSRKRRLMAHRETPFEYVDIIADLITDDPDILSID